MNNKELDKIIKVFEKKSADIIYQAVQATKKENSGLILDIKNQIKEIKDDFDEHQEKMEPVYQWFQNMNFLKKTAIWILGFIATIGALLLWLKEFFK